MAAALGPEAIEKIEADVAALRAAQEAPDDPAAVAKLPQLTRSDIGPAPAEEPWEVTEAAGMTCIRHRVAAHGIAYAYRYFDLAGVSFDELPYVTVLAGVLGRLDTARHTAAELDTLVQGRLGSLRFFTEVHENVDDPAQLRPTLVAGASALSENVAWMAELAREVLAETDFSDIDRIRDILGQQRIGLEQSFSANGHSFAMARASSYCLPAGVVRESLGGVDYYRFLRDLLEHFDERAEGLAAKLEALARRLFADASCTLSFTGSDDDLATRRRSSRFRAPRRQLSSWCPSPCAVGRRSSCPPTSPTRPWPGIVADSGCPIRGCGFWPPAFCPTTTSGARCA